MLSIAITQFSEDSEEDIKLFELKIREIAKKYPQIFLNNPAKLYCSPKGYTFYNKLMSQIYFTKDNAMLNHPLNQNDFAMGDRQRPDLWIKFLSRLDLPSVNRKTFNRLMDRGAPCRSFDGQLIHRNAFPIYVRFVLEKEIPYEKISEFKEDPTHVLSSNLEKDLWKKLVATRKLNFSFSIIYKQIEKRLKEGYFRLKD